MSSLEPSRTGAALLGLASRQTEAASRPCPPYGSVNPKTGVGSLGQLQFLSANYIFLRSNPSSKYIEGLLGRKCYFGGELPILDHTLWM